MKENIMREVRIEKMIVSASGIAEKLDREVKLLKAVTGRTPKRMKSNKRIPSLGVRPGLDVGCVVTIRKNAEIKELLNRLFEAVDNQLSLQNIKDNHFSFGIKEYIEIPGMEYNRDIGVLGLKATVVFARKGKRVVYRKIKTGKLPKRQAVTPEEIIKFMKENFKIEIK